jgi:DNA-binding MarR family transcriptional regulator
MSSQSEAKKRKFDSQQQEVYLSLWRTYDRLKALEDELFQSWDLTSQQYNVLRILQAASPKAVPTLQISQRLISRAPDITRMLDKLQERKLVSRLRSQEDRRTVLVEITPEGLELLEKLQGVAHFAVRPFDGGRLHRVVQIAPEVPRTSRTSKRPLVIRPLGVPIATETIQADHPR